MTLNKIASFLLFFCGIIFLLSAGFLMYKRNVNRNLQIDPSVLGKFFFSEGSKLPVLISISDLKINLPVFRSEVKNGVWETSEDGVSYLEQSPIPGEMGNSILYGHNYPGMLGNLTRIEKGALIEITFNTGEKKVFEVKDMFSVLPSQTHVLKNTEDTRITLYTCSGFLDSKRFIVTAVPK